MSYDDFELSPHQGSKVELYLFYTEDGLHKWAYTTDRQPKVALGSTFLPEKISRSDLHQVADASATDPLTITIPFDNPVAVIHVPYMPPRPIRVDVFSYQRRDVGVEIKQGFSGYISNFAQKGALATLNCSQITEAGSQLVPWAVFKQGCIWATYEEGCFADRSAFQTNATITDATDDVIHSADFATHVDGWFTGGYAVNPANGETRFITSHVGTEIKVVHAFSGEIAGAVLQAFAGDDLQPETCRLKFNNKDNYTGFDHSPAINLFAVGTS